MPVDVVNLWWDLRMSIVLFTPYIPSRRDICDVQAAFYGSKSDRDEAFYHADIPCS